nr:leucyl aminopeptidase family protein [Rhodothalassium salexigens]
MFEGSLPMTPKPETLFVAADAAEAKGATPVRPVAAAGVEAWRKGLDAPQRRWAEMQDFKAAKGSVVTLPSAKGGLEAVALGLGEDGAEMADIWAYAALAEAVPAGVYRIDADLSADAARHAALGWGLAQYRFERYRKAAEAVEPRRLVLPEGLALADAVAALEGLFMVRDLVNTPTEHMGPRQLADEAGILAQRHQASFRCIEGDHLLDEGFPLIHAVGRASATPPILIDLRWGRADAPKLTLVGKGVCFDSGGLDLKPSNAMRLMKKDMGGAAHALGLAHWIMTAGLDVRLRVLIPAVENAVAGNAFRPGDVLSSRAGHSVEITNTDAEGRLVLADALTYAAEDKPDLVLDFATLTGAARVALGADVPALFTPDHKLAAALAQTAAAEGDPVWRLPLYAPYEEDLKSPIADMVNAAENGMAGAITAALFLQRFAADLPQWAHFDVYAYNQRNRAGRPQGGEAMALRTVFRYLAERFSAA